VSAKMVTAETVQLKTMSKEWMLPRPAEIALKVSMPCPPPAAERMISAARRGCDATETKDQIIAGIGLVFHSLRFLYLQRSLWRLALVPVVINILIFVVATVALYHGSAEWIKELWPEPQLTTWSDAVMVFAWWVLRALIVVMVFVASYFLALVVGGLVSGPFLDELSSECETILYGTKQVANQGAWSTLTSTLSSFSVIGLAFVIYVFAMLPVMLLCIIPGGGLVALPLSFGLSGCFLSFQYCDPVFARRGLGWGARTKLLWRFRGFSFGFGLGAQALLWMPMANLLAIPAVVVAGTCLAATIATKDEQNL
jgi:CysZ protein